MSVISRQALKNLFKTGSKPTEDAFADFIDSMVNCKDDGIRKQAGQNMPLRIKAFDDQENLLDFSLEETGFNWRLSQKALPEEKRGFNIIDSSGKSRLFIDEQLGNVGINQTRPSAKLHVNATLDQDMLRIDSASQNTLLILNNEGNLGIGTTNPQAKLEVKGDIKLGTGVAVNEFSDDASLRQKRNTAVPTEYAVRSYVDLKISQGMGMYPFHYYSDDTVSCPDTNEFIIPFSQKKVDPDEVFTQRTTFTAPENGVYCFNVNISFFIKTKENDEIQLEFFKNAEVVSPLICNPPLNVFLGSTYCCISNSVVVELNQGDTFKIRLSGIGHPDYWGIADRNFNGFMLYYTG